MEVQVLFLKIPESLCLLMVFPPNSLEKRCQEVGKGYLRG